ncbi:hypothetical protein NQ317_000640, partial [Molorchus minor]
LPKRPAEDEYGYAFEALAVINRYLPNLAYLCSRHFKPEDILVSSTGSKRYLKPDAFSLSLPFTKISDDGDNSSTPSRPSTSECRKGSGPHLIQSSTS